MKLAGYSGQEIASANDDEWTIVSYYRLREWLHT